MGYIAFATNTTAAVCAAPSTDSAVPTTQSGPD